MAVKSGFFMSVNGDRRYDAAFFAEYFSSFIGNGIFPNPSTNLQVAEGSNMRTIVKAGKAWINGYYLHNDSDLVLQHGVAHGTMKRIDRIVVRWNVLTRQMVIEILKGTNATSPVAPAITRDTNYYDLVLADVYINAGAIQITQANITDQRLNSALCGVVTQTVKTVDTTTLFNQYQSWINQQKINYEADLATWTTTQKGSFESWRNAQQTSFTDWMTTEKNGFGSWRNTQQTAFTNWMATEKSEFDAWFINLQEILNGDVATNLQTQIDQHKAEINPHRTTSEQINHIASKLVTDSPSTYPIGFSIFGLDMTQTSTWRTAVDSSLTGLSYALVETLVGNSPPSNTRMVQRITFTSTTSANVHGTYEREGYSTTWYPWKKVLTSGDLENSLTSTSAKKAATANAVKQAYDRGNAAFTNVNELRTEFDAFKSALTDGFTANQFSDGLTTLDAFNVTAGYYNQSLSRLEV